jgi:hypothetical protein
MLLGHGWKVLHPMFYGTHLPTVIWKTTTMT